MSDNKYLKGDPFVNRVRITGTLTTRSPLHVGTGQLSAYTETTKEGKEEQRKKAMIITDHRGKPLIPGSSLRGVMRHWLLQILQGMGDTWASFPNRDTLQDVNQADQIEVMRESFSWLELLFGTTFNAGKIEVWDTECLTGEIDAPDSLLHWNKKNLTYVSTSVVIDPETGTAKEQLLYNSELVPRGVQFRITITGQNLSDTELGLVLLALKGFNSQIYPIRVGARSGRGYGLMEFKLEKIYYLGKDDAATWIAGLINSLDDSEKAEDAGYFALPELDSQKQTTLLQQAKQALLQAMEA